MSNRCVKLTVITDFICGSCFVGHHELLNAISYCKDSLKLPLDFDLEHLPFRLVSLTCLPDGTTISRQEFLAKHLGKERSVKIQAAIIKWAEEKGITLTQAGVVCQTTRAHRLCRKAYKLGGQDLQVPLVHAIFKAVMEDGKNISDMQLLAQLAAESNTMTKDEAIAFLQSEELAAEVDTMCSEARAKGITGVPMTIIDGKWAVSGGQSSDVFIQIFKKLAAAGPHNAPSPFPAAMVDTALVA